MVHRGGLESGPPSVGDGCRQYWPGVEKRRNLTQFLEGHPPPRPPQLVGLEASQILDLYLISNTNRPFWRPPGRLIGGVWGSDAPPGIKLSCVFSQPQASICLRQFQIHREFTIIQLPSANPPPCPSQGVCVFSCARDVCVCVCVCVSSCAGSMQRCIVSSMHSSIHRFERCLDSSFDSSMYQMRPMW